jgi:hypothetical protein
MVIPLGAGVRAIFVSTCKEFGRTDGGRLVGVVAAGMEINSSGVEIGVDRSVILKDLMITMTRVR